MAWGISTSAAWYLYNRNKSYDRWNASFITCFSTIQLLEAGIWKTDPNGKPTKTNEVLTKLILLGLSAQPLVQTYVGYRYTYQPVLWYLSWVLVGLVVYSLWRILKAGPGDFYSSVGEGGHLVWHTNGVKGKESETGGIFGGKGLGGLYMLGLFLPLMFMKNGAGLPLLAVGAITAIYSLFVAKKGEFGSFWCYTAVMYSIMAILLPSN